MPVKKHVSWPLLKKDAGWSASDIQQNRGLFHQPEPPFIEHTDHTVCSRQAKGDHVHFREQRIHSFRCHHLRADPSRIDFRIR